MIERIYVITHPRSQTNPSDQYLVVEYYDWLSYVDKRTTSFTTHAKVTTYEEARAERDRLNRIGR